MRMRATLTIDIEVTDYMQAGEHEARLRELQQELKDRYGCASLEFKERRPRPAVDGTAASVARIVPRTGRLPAYEH